MLETQDATSPLWWNRPVVYWLENQVAITFHSQLAYTENPESIISSLKLEVLNRFLNAGGFNLQSFTSSDVPHDPNPICEEIEQLEAELERREAELEALERSRWSRSDIEEREKRIEELEREIEQRERVLQTGGQQNGSKPQDGMAPSPTSAVASAINSRVGKYIFSPPSGSGSLVVCFFHGGSAGKASSMQNMKSMGGNSGMGASGADTTQSLVTYLNQNLDKLRQDGKIPIVAAMPNWTGGGTNGVGSDSGVGHGCPITPPIPVGGSETCADHPGRFPISLPQLSDTMKGMRGDGVQVFVLDTVPQLGDIINAAANAGDNMLLAEMVMAIEAGKIVIGDQSVPKKIRTSIRTGKDVYGRLFGFDMPDHGLFVAGIIHDLAPDAKIECMRVLNDYGIGTFAIICAALEKIQGRMLGPDAPKQVVINLSLVVTPADEELAGLWFDDNRCCHAGDIASMMYEVSLLRAGLHFVIKSLTSLGAVVVASAGNDSDADAQYIQMNTGMGMGMPSNMPLRFGPRYPAAFPEVISVGAVYEDGQAAYYSNYPALPPNNNGIATHGGNKPNVTSSTVGRPAGAKTWATVSDGIIGVYSATSYPLLSADDLPPSDYPAPADNAAWAYWSGTSFATPVISAVAARVLQARSAGAIASASSVQDTITTATGQQAILSGGTKLAHNTAFGNNVSVLKAEQCQPVSSEGVVSGPGHAVVHGG